MRSRLVAIAPVVVAAGILLLGWLQWRWIDRVAEADLAREEARLRSALGRIAAEIDTEVTRAVFFFSGGPPDPNILQDLRMRMLEWHAMAAAPRLVGGILVRDDSGSLQRIRQDGVIEAAEAPAEGFPEFRRAGPGGGPRLLSGNLAFPLRGGMRGRRPPGRFGPPGEFLGLAPPSPPPPPRFLLLDREALEQRIVPSLVRRHLAGSDYTARLVRPDDTPQSGPAPVASVSVVAVRPGCLMDDDRPSAGMGIGPPGMPGRGPAGPHVLRLRSACLDDPPSEHGWWTLELRHASGNTTSGWRSAQNRNRAVTLAGTALSLGALGALLLASRRARQLAQEQVAFAMSVSHELRTPLTVMRLAGDNLATGIVAPEQARRYGETVRREAERLSSMVDQVLTFARSGQTDWTADTAPVEASSVVDAAVAATAPVCREAGVELVRETESELPPVLADANLLTSALTNLLVNAARHGGTGKWARVRAFHKGDAVVFEVADRGQGIPRQDLRRMFQPFVRGRRSGGVRGTGLGLHLVKRIADAHSGSVTIESNQGTGTVVRLSIPTAGRSLSEPVA